MKIYPWVGKGQMRVFMDPRSINRLGNPGEVFNGRWGRVDIPIGPATDH